MKKLAIELGLLLIFITIIIFSVLLFSKSVKIFNHYNDLNTGIVVVVNKLKTDSYVDISYDDDHYIGITLLHPNDSITYYNVPIGHIKINHEEFSIAKDSIWINRELLKVYLKPNEKIIKALE